LLHRPLNGDHIFDLIECRHEDDGRSFDYRRGEWMGTRLKWNDAGRTLNLSLEPDSRMLGPLQRTISVKLLNSEKTVAFNGKPTK
jgi:hypothetical protein